MIVTMLMVTVSMAACGGKKDTTADKESVINTEATEEVAETEEPATEELEAATETEEPETEAVAEQGDHWKTGEQYFQCREYCSTAI